MLFVTKVTFAQSLENDRLPSLCFIHTSHLALSSNILSYEDKASCTGETFHLVNKISTKELLLGGLFKEFVDFV